jgi:hypothetical protein
MNNTCDYPDCGRRAAVRHAAIDFENDIPFELAKAAHYGTSFVPDDQAWQTRQNYAETLSQDYEKLRLEVKPECIGTLNEEFARYRTGYAERMRGYLRSRSRVMSSMITGPSKFPTARNRKRSDISDKRLHEVVEFRQRALSAIRKKLRPELAPIMAGDCDATGRLAEKIAQAEKAQERMKAANKIVRKFRDDPHSGRLALEQIGFTAGHAAKLFEPDFCGRLGFPDYEIKNNNANIRRMRARLVQIERMQSQDDTTIEGANARIEDCPAENRVRLFFPGKPPVEIRARLKAGSFRWTPSLGCWQAYRNPRSLDLANAIARISPEAVQ